VLGGMARGALPAQAVVGNRLVTIVIGLLYRRWLTDLPSFKAIRRQTLDGFQMREMTYGWTTEMIVKAVACARSLRSVSVPRARWWPIEYPRHAQGTLLAGYRLIATTLRYAR
jgi:hypothetical protein